MYPRDRSKRLIGLIQNTYIDKVLKRFSMLNSKKGMVPMVLKKSLGKARCLMTRQARDYISRIPYASVLDLSCMSCFVHVLLSHLL